MKRTLLRLLLTGCFFAACSVFAQTPPPNIIVILADDLGYGDVAFNGCPDIPTPSLDSLVAHGVLCTNGYVTMPFCSPSRAGLMTGRYQQRFGYENQPGDDINPLLGLPETELTLPQILKPAGYVCGAIGKWHLGQAPNLHPLARGFDEFFGFLRAAAFPGYYNAQLLRNETPVTEPSYLTDAFTREALSFIDRHETQPFFLYLAYNAVHAPYDAPPQIYLDRVSGIPDPLRRNYAGMVVALDAGIGRVLGKLRRDKLSKNTLIFFLSDNGAPTTGFTSNAPFRGWKMNVVEGGIHVPFAVQWTGHLPSHTVYDDPVSSLDIVSSAAAVAGVSLPTDRSYDGLNIIPYLAGQQTAPPRALYWRWFGLGPTGPSGSIDTIWAVRSGPLKLVVERGKVGLPPALYNLPDDVYEQNDLAAIHPEDAAALHSLYDRWTFNTIPPIWQQGTEFSSIPLVLAGDWNGFNKGYTNPPWGLTRITAPGEEDGTPDGFNWFTTTIHVATTGGDTTPGTHSFVLIGKSSYTNQWGGMTIQVDDVTTLPYYSGSGLGATNTISFDNNFYYSFRVLDPQYSVPIDLDVGVMKTSSPPVTVSRTGQVPAIPTPLDPVTVNIATSPRKSPEERIYVRWTTDMFITSQLIEATGSGTSYSATIPPQPAGTFLEYSIITSTADLTPYSTSAAIDARILATSGAFDVFPSGGPVPTPTPAPPHP